MKFKYIYRIASVIAASLLLILVGSKIPKEQEERP